MSTPVRDAVMEVLKDAPVPGTATIYLCGIPLQSWILFLTALWALVRAADILITIYWKWKDRKYEQSLREANGYPPRGPRQNPDPHGRGADHSQGNE